MMQFPPNNGTHLVTGTAGFIGFHLANRLLQDGRQVVGIDNVNDYYDPTLKEARLQKLSKFKSFVNHRIDLEDRDRLSAVFNSVKPSVVINLAAQAGVRYSLGNPRAYLDSNIIGFGNILEECRHNEVGHLVYASSSSVYGLSTKTPFSVSDVVDHPISLYGASKKSNELMAHTYSHLFGIPTTGLRFFTVYGPWGRPDMALFLFTRAILSDEEIKVFNYGKMKRDFTYIDDIVEGIVRITDSPATIDSDWTENDPTLGSSSAPYRIYNIGNNNPVELMHLIETLENALDRKAKKRLMPIQAGDVMETYANIDPLVSNFGFKPDTRIEDGVDLFVKWYYSYYGKAD